MINNSAQRYFENMHNREVDIEHYTELLQNDIWLDVQWKLWNFRERESSKMASVYGACNHIMTLLEKTIKHTIDEI